MERYENIIKIEEIRRLIDENLYTKAAKILDTMDISRIKALTDLSIIADVLTQNDRYEEAIEILLKIYNKSKTRRVLYQLVDISIRMEDLDKANEYLKLYIKLAPTDSQRFVFRYCIDKLNQESYEVLLDSLEQLKEYEYIETWAYELAKVYHKAGMKDKCVRECSDIILWFGEGAYVEKAKLLKAFYVGEINSAQIISAKNKKDALKQRGLDKTKDYSSMRAEINEYLAKEEKEMALKKAENTSIENSETLETSETVSFENSGTVPYEHREELEIKSYNNNYHENDYIGKDLGHESSEDINKENNKDNLNKEFLDKKYIEKDYINSLVEPISNIQINMNHEVYEESLVVAKNQVNVAGHNELINPIAELVAATIEKSLISDIDTDIENNIKIDQEEKIEVNENNDVNAEVDANIYADTSTDKSKNEVTSTDKYITADTSASKSKNEDTSTDINTSTDISTNADTSTDTSTNADIDTNPDTSISKNINKDTIIDENINVVASTEINSNVDLSIDTELYLNKDLNVGINTDVNTVRESETDIYGFFSKAGFHVQEEFGSFLLVNGLKEQIGSTLENILSDSININHLVISGKKKSGRTTLAKKICKGLFVLDWIKSPKIAKITGDKLNRVNLLQQKVKLENSTIVVEDASHLTEDACHRLVDFIEEMRDNIFVILEDEDKNIEELFLKYPFVSTYFMNRIIIGDYSDRDLFRFSEEYISQHNYQFLTEAKVDFFQKIGQILLESDQPLEESINLAKVSVKSADNRYKSQLAEILNNRNLDTEDLLYIVKEDIGGFNG